MGTLAALPQISSTPRSDPARERGAALWPRPRRGRTGGAQQEPDPRGLLRARRRPPLACALCNRPARWPPWNRRAYETVLLSSFPMRRGFLLRQKSRAEAEARRSLPLPREPEPLRTTFRALPARLGEGPDALGKAQLFGYTEKRYRIGRRGHRESSGWLEPGEAFHKRSDRQCALTRNGRRFLIRLV